MSEDTSRLSGEFLGPLLRTLADSLDVREIFRRISDEAHRIVPHDFLMLGLVSEDQTRVRVVALSGDVPAVPGDVAFPDPLRFVIDQDVFVLNDMKPGPDGRAFAGWLRPDGGETRQPVEVPVQPLFRQLVEARGLRSFMRVTVRLRGGVLGGLVFCSTSTDAYPPASIPPARQIADIVALTLAHQRLAEEEQRSAEARER